MESFDILLSDSLGLPKDAQTHRRTERDRRGCAPRGHYNSSKAACSQCGLKRSWAEVLKGVQQTNSTTPPSQPKEEIKALGGSTCCTTRQCRSLWKSTCSSGGKTSTRPQRGARQQTFGSTSRRMQRHPTARFQGKASFECSATSTTSGIRKSGGGRVSFSSRTCRTRETGTFANRTANLLADHLLQSGSPSAAEKASRTETEGSATCVWDCDDEDLDLDIPDDVVLDTLKRGSEDDAQQTLRAVRRRIRVKCAVVPMRGPMAASESTAG